MGANLWPEDNTAALPLWRSGGTLSCATGPLLLPWLAATTGNGTALVKSAANIPYLSVLRADSLNVVDLVNADTIIVEQSALAEIQEVYG